MDISDPSNPTYVGDVHTEGGNGGYAFHKKIMDPAGDSLGVRSLICPIGIILLKLEQAIWQEI